VAEVSDVQFDVVTVRTPGRAASMPVIATALLSAAMNRNLVGWAREILTASGVAMVAAFFLAWTAFGRVSGLGMAWNGEHVLFLVPLAGVALAVAARGPWARLAALAAGVLVVGDVAFQIVSGVLDAGLATYLMLGGAALALASVAKPTTSRNGLAIAGGVAILAGFFAPWDDISLFGALRDEGTRSLSYAMGLHLDILWLVLVGGVCAIASGLGARNARALAAAAGISVIGSLVMYVGTAVWAVSAWGAWITLGAAATALVVGLIAPHTTPANDDPTDR
jgi:hypothetical protein